MTILAIELHHRSGWTSSDSAHVQRMIQFDCPAVIGSHSRNRAQRSKLRMPILKAANVVRVRGNAIRDRKIAMALRTRLISRRHQTNAPTMLDVTIGAREFRIGIRCVMCWASPTMATCRDTFG